MNKILSNPLCCLQKMTKVQSKPFPYLEIRDALPANIYSELAESFPEEIITRDPPYAGHTYRYKSNPALIDREIPKIWQEFFELHTSSEYFNSCIELFSSFLGEDAVKLLTKATKTTRNIDNTGQLVTDCQFVINEPLGSDLTSRTPHLDNPVEIYAGLLYLRKPNDTAKGGDFTVHKQTKKINQLSKVNGRPVPPDSHLPVRSIPYAANTFCMFLNVKNSIHSVSPRIEPKERRLSVNIIGEFNNNGHMWDIKHV